MHMYNRFVFSKGNINGARQQKNTDGVVKDKKL